MIFKKLNIKQYSILAISLPLILEFLLTNLFGCVDTLMISNYSSTGPGSIANSNTIVGVLNSLLVVLTIGANVIIAAFLGSNKKDKARDTYSSCAVINFCLGIIIFILLESFASIIFKVINTPSELIDDSITYLRIYAICIPFLSIDYILKANLRSYSKTNFLLLFSVISNLINVLLNYFFIYGCGSLPALGVKGAAIATIISQLIGFLLKLCFIRFKLKVKLFPLTINKDILKIVVKIGGPSALEGACFMISTLFVTAACNTLGTTTLLARTYLMTVITLINQISIGFGQGNQTICSYHVGTGRKDLITKSTNKSFLIDLPILLILVGIINLLTFQIFGLFTSSEDVLSLIKQVAPILFLTVIAQSMSHIYVAALKGLSDIMVNIFTSFISSFLLCALGSWVFGVWLNLGLLGVFIAIGMDELTRGSVALIRFLTKKWEIHSQNEKQIIDSIQ